MQMLFLATVTFFTMAVACAFITNVLVEDALEYRCVPTNFSAPEVQSNEYYQTFGDDYFTSRFNTLLCGSGGFQCDTGFTCTDIGYTWGSIFADFDTPLRAFVTNLGFITLRGWPLTWQAITATEGDKTAFLVLVICFGLVGLLCANLFAAIFFASLREDDEREKKMLWVDAYPGTKNTVTEYDLLLWANANPLYTSAQRAIRAQKEQGKVYEALMSKIRWIWGGKSASALAAEMAHRLEGEILAKQGADIVKKKKGAGASAEGDKAEAIRNASEAAAAAARVPRYSCVPPCQAFRKIRDILDDEFSVLNLIVFGVIVFNLFVLAMDSPTYPRDVRVAAIIMNYACSGVYILEVLVKITVYGPCMYFSSGWNQYDFLLTILMLPQYEYSRFRLVNNFRLLRIMKIAQSMHDPSTHSRESYAVSEYVTPSKVVRIISGHLPFVLGSVAFNLLMLFIFACMGMQFFNGDNFPSSLYSNTDMVVFNQSSFTTPEIAEAQYLFGGEYVERMNYNNFINAYYTVFNLSLLNLFYQAMVFEIEQYNIGALAYYFMILLVCFYLPSATILSSMMAVVENDARETLSLLAIQNKRKVERTGEIAMTCQMRKLFRHWQRNSEEEGEGENQITGQVNDEKQQRPMVEEGEEAELASGEFIEWLKSRDKYSFYIFHPLGCVRQFLLFFFDLTATNLLITLAVLGTVTAVITEQSEDIMPGVGWKQVNRFCGGIFLVEMVLKMVAYRVYGVPGAYLHNVINSIDVILNFFLLLEAFTSIRLINQFRLVRLIKLLDLLPRIVKAETLETLVASIRKASESYLSVIVVAGAIVLCISIITMQLFADRFQYCSYPAYPGGASLTGSPAGYPNGCSGNIVDARTNQTIAIHEETRRDDFDGIFAAGTSIFRIVTRNEFAPILYSAADVTGQNDQPENFASEGWLAYWIVVVTLSYSLMYLPAAIIYFHFFCTDATKGRKYVIGENDAFWVTYESRLRMVAPQTVASKVDRNLRQSFFLKACAILLVVVPQGFSLGNMYDRGLFRDEESTVYVNLVANILFILLTLYRFFRDISTPPIVDLMISCFLVAGTYAMLSHLIDANAAKLGSDAVFEFALKTSMILRYNVLLLFYEEIFTLYKVIYLSLLGIVPLLLYAITLVLLYGVVGYDIWQDKDLNIENNFVEQFINFNTLENSWMTLIAMGSGNMWTTVVQAVKVDYSTGAQILVDVYFYSFFVIFYFLLQAFPVLVIYYYGRYCTGNIGLAGQQVREFQRAWASKGNPTRMSYSKLLKLLADLPAPLGLKGQTPCFKDLSIFARAVIGCLPHDDSGLLAKDGNRGDLMFPQGTLPEDLRMFDDEYRKMQSKVDAQLRELDYDMDLVDEFRKGFTFTQVIIATHRRVVLNVSGGLGGKDNVHRKMAKQKLFLIRMRLVNLMTRRMDKPEQEHLPVVPGYTLAATLQKIDKKLHRKLYSEIVAHILSSVTLKAKFFGFSGKDIFYLSKLRAATKAEVRVTRCMVQLQQKLVYPGCTPKVLNNLEHTQNYYGHLKHFDSKMDNVYGETADNIWDIDTLYEVAALGDFGAVSAVAVDNHSSVYAAFAKGFIKIWNTSKADVSEDSRFKLHQKLEIPGAARCMHVTKKRDQIIVAVNNEVVIYSNRNRSRRQFHELYRFYDHTSTVNTVIYHDSFYISGGQDGRVLLWNMRYSEPLKDCFVGFGVSIFCFELLTLSDDTTPTEENTLSHVLAVGDSSGHISFLALPSHLANSSELKIPWEAHRHHCGDSQITAISYNWGYVYTGFANGSVRTWAMQIDKVQLTSLQPIHAISLIALSNEPVHSAPVTQIFQAGGRLFSTSHDYSVLPWKPPEKLKVMDSANFSQEIDAGKVLHSYPIIAAAANRFLIVTGDEFGKVRITAPGVFSDNIGIGESMNDAFSVKLETAVKFSFMQHDFGHCFVSHQDKTVEEEIILTVTNVSGFPLTIRSLPCHDENFHIERDLALSMEAIKQADGRTGLPGVKMVQIDGEIHRNGKKIQKTAMQIDSFQSMRYRIIFKPKFAGKKQGEFEFSINEKRVVKVHCKGQGAKPKVLIENGIKMFDFETHIVGEKNEPLSFNAVNTSSKGITVFILDDLYPEDASSSDQYNMAERQIMVTPRVFHIAGKSKVRVELSFTPTRAYKTFPLKLRFAYCGGEYTVADILARSVEKKEDYVIDQPAVPYRNPNAIFPMMRKFGVNEAFCTFPVVFQQLYMLGWRISVNEDIAVLLHKQSGMFLEIIKDMSDKIEELSTIEVNFECTSPCCYMLVRSSDKKVLKQGSVKTAGAVSIPYVLDADMGKDQSLDFGYESLELRIYQPQTPAFKGQSMHRIRSSIAMGQGMRGSVLSRKSGSKVGSLYAESETSTAVGGVDRLLATRSASTLYMSRDTENAPQDSEDTTKFMPKSSMEPYCIYHIRIQKGFRVHKSRNDLKIYMQPRFNICGIERIVTNMHKRAGSVHEIFGVIPGSHTPKYRIASSRFSEVLVILKGIDSATHYTLSEYLESEEGESMKTKELGRHEGLFTTAAASTHKDKEHEICIETKQLPSPAVHDPNPDFPVYRKLKVEAKKDDFSHEQSKSKKTTVMSDEIPCHRACDLIARAKATKLSPQLLLPCEVTSMHMSVEIRHANTSSDDLLESEIKAVAKEMDILNRTANKDLPDMDFQAEITGLFARDSSWFPVMKKGQLSFVSKEFEGDVSPGDDAELTSELTFWVNGIVMKGTRFIRTDLKKLKSYSRLEVMEREEGVMSENTLRLWNEYGHSQWPGEEPQLLLTVWNKMLDDERVSIVKKTFFRIARAQVNKDLMAARERADAIQKHFDDHLEKAMENRPIKRMTAEEMRRQMAVKDEMTRIYDSVPEEVTYREVYNEMITTTEGKDSKKTQLSIHSLRRYLYTNSLEASSKPFTPAQAFLLLKDINHDEGGNITEQFFKKWYESDEVKNMANMLTEKTIWPQLLNEELNKMNNSSDLVMRSPSQGMFSPKSPHELNSSFVGSKTYNKRYGGRDSESKEAAVDEVAAGIVLNESSVRTPPVRTQKRKSMRAIFSARFSKAPKDEVQLEDLTFDHELGADGTAVTRRRSSIWDQSTGTADVIESIRSPSPLKESLSASEDPGMSTRFGLLGTRFASKKHDDFSSSRQSALAGASTVESAPMSIDIPADQMADIL